MRVPAAANIGVANSGDRVARQLLVPGGQQRLQQQSPVGLVVGIDVPHAAREPLGFAEAPSREPPPHDDDFLKDVPF